MEKKKILIVDDEEMIRDMVKEFLESHDFEVLLADNGKLGVEAAKKELPDLILMDVNMPVMNGFQALEKIKKDQKTMLIPVFMFTTRQDAEDIQKGMEKYADKYLPKPFSHDKLLQEIQSTLSRTAG